MTTQLERLVTLENYNSLFLFGARGVGKSTLLRHRVQSTAFASINLLSDAEFYSLSQRPESLRDRLSKAPAGSLVIIDEVQRVPALLNMVHLLIEEHGLKFILTGSSSRKLRRGNANLLAGRADLYELFPLTHTELGGAFDLSSALDWGTLPSLITRTTNQAKIDYLQSYVDTYLKEEIVAEQLVRNLPPFRRFLDVAAQMNGKIVNFSAIAREIGTTSDTVKQYFSILEETHIGYCLPAFHSSVRKQIIQAPKFYFFDCGVPRAILRTNEASLREDTSAYGDAFEHFIFLELLRLSSYKRNRAQFFYLKTKDNAEIDIIIDLPNKPLTLVKVKSSHNIHPEDLSGFAKLGSDFPNAAMFCLSRDPVEKEIRGVRVMPWQQGLELILRREREEPR
jgi:predicted AAA+ superfamily ATPase